MFISALVKRVYLIILFCLMSPSLWGMTLDGSEKTPNTSDKTEKREECLHGQHACDINNKVKNVENTITDMTGKLKDKGLWKLEDNKGFLSRHRMMAHLINTPSYLTRAITWPVAVISSSLVKTGVVGKIVDVISNDERTFWVYPLLEMGFGSGFGGGIGVQHTDLFHKNFKFAASYVNHINMNQGGTFSFGKPDAAFLNQPISYNFVADWKHYNDSNYYGIGPNTLKSAQSIYGIDALNISGSFGFKIIKHLYLYGNFSVDMDSTRPGSHASSPSINNMFPIASLPGFDKRITFISPGLSIEHDTRNAPVVAQSGGLRSLSIQNHHSTDPEGFNYNQYTLKALQYFRLWAPRHVLALRTVWNYEQQVGDNAIPFYNLSVLDVTSPLRGFQSGRFRDRGSALFNMEYLFPVWDYMDGKLFVETGRVFHSPSDFSFKYFKYSAGAGFCWQTKELFLLRFEVAYGGEGTRILFKTSRAF